MIKCSYNLCKYSCKTGSGCTLKKSTIGANGKCENMEYGFSYYFIYAISKMRGNMIPTFNMSDKMRCSLYYIVRCMPVVYSIDPVRGIIILADEKDESKILSSDDLLKMIDDGRLNKEEFNKCFEEFEKDGLPIKYNEDTENTKKEERKYKEYGWLSPTGQFYETSWGDHEDKASDIIKKNGWTQEYEDWLLEQPNNTLGINYRDFLIGVKHFALIHDPSTLGYTVSHKGELTKKQKDFLYGYFLDMGMKLRAEKYAQEDN